jgi:glutamate formiminotransferase/formiminotetrahydrofolate cyclodeaminase
MKVAYSAFDLVEAMAKEGNPNSLSDAGVGALALRSAIYGAYMNVRINSADLKDKTVSEKLVNEAQQIFDLASSREKSIIESVLATLGSK